MVFHLHYNRLKNIIIKKNIFKVYLLDNIHQNFINILIIQEIKLILVKE